MSQPPMKLHPMDNSNGNHTNARNNESIPLPRTVRGAPPGLRRAIRKRQNSESAKRCRERKKLQTEQAQALSDIQAKALQRLEVIISILSKRVDSTVSIVANLAQRINGPHQQQQQNQVYMNPQQQPFLLKAMTSMTAPVAPPQRPMPNILNGSASSISNSSNEVNSLVAKVEQLERDSQWKFSNH